MAERTGEQILRQQLTALADGELSSRQILEVLDHLATDPSALSWLKGEHRLRLEAQRAILEQTPAVPAELRERISKIASQVAVAGKISPAPLWQSHAWRLASLATAAMIAGILIGFFAHAPDAIPVTGPPMAAVVPIALAATITHIHVDCSRMTAAHTAPFPRELATLSADVQADLQRSEPRPDLSKIGYRFVGAGPCAKPLQNTAHLLYESQGGNAHDTLSIFVQPNTGQFSMQVGKVYLVSPPDSSHPMLAWRTDRVVYFLVGDAIQVVEAAKDAILPRS